MRNAILNIARDIDIDDDRRSLFIRYIDELTPTHLTILNYFKNPKEVLEQKRINYTNIQANSADYFAMAYPNLEEYLDLFVRELIAYGLIPSGEWLHTGMSTPNISRISAIGLKFLDFVKFSYRELNFI